MNESPNILIILNHHHPDGFCYQLAQTYTTAAESAGASVKLTRLHELSFNPVLTSGYGEEQPLEPDLKQAQHDILWADHIVFVFPVWWASLPALLKGFIDRTFLPHFAYTYEPDQLMQTKLLGGRTASIISTMDSPSWWYRLKHGRAAHKMLKAATLDFVGIKTTTQRTIYKTRELSTLQRANWQQRIATDAKHQATRRPLTRSSMSKA